MYKVAISALVALALVAVAVPGSADHRDTEATYVLGNGLLVVSDDIEGTGLPGVSLGGAFDLTNPSAPALPTVTVIDDVHGELEAGEAQEPLTYFLQCDDGNAHCSVFVNAGAISGTITLS